MFVFIKKKTRFRQNLIFNHSTLLWQQVQCGVQFRVKKFYEMHFCRKF